MSLLVPSFTEERVLGAQGFCHVAGIDEVGRGALAGPVVAAAVILPAQIDYGWLSLVRDSKQLSPKKREYLLSRIVEVAVTIGIGRINGEVIDSCGIVRATQMAMKAAVEGLSPQADALLIDYMSLPQVSLPQKGITNGDCRCLSIACASIVAKVTRDRIMKELDQYYPGYAMAQHKGYGTSEHISCLYRLGPSPVHRQTFRPVREMIR
ncbi:MAG: ribonuclease HII [Dehalococcoidales bacterium]|nr:MAG: ribonuclease HII [Dehalococcoidales bacterium]